MEPKEENKKSDVALREEAVLEFWRANKTFEKSLTKKSPKGHYVFYDGPPFATGQIHYGHILGSTVKDVIGRYKTMEGYYVPRKWGWDCHGLPIENIVEKELGVAGHKEIEKLGIDKFVEHARSKVLEYENDWEKGIERIGRWVDFRGGYKTMDNTFIESVWWALSELNKKKLIYEGVRVLAYCPRCETPIANSEIAMDNSYKDITDISVYVKFELEDEPGTYLLAWTTTPWTLPGNTAIAINKDIVYVKIKVGDDVLILAKETLQNVLKDKEYSVVGEIKASELVGKKYKPVFPYYKNSDAAKNENIWKVWEADFVTIEKGTGIAHEAPAFGEEDMILAKEKNIPWIMHVDETGRFTPEVSDFAGMLVKPKSTEKDGHQKADVEVIKYLAKNGTLFAKEKIIHSYPHCMRCDTPIIYYALPSWFINITEVKDNIIKQSHSINWVPGHLKEGRFKNIVENAPDWNISRNRYWASPLPIWKCQKCKEQHFISSLEDLKNRTKKSGNKYFVMRHGQADNNVGDICRRIGSEKANLTDKGREQVAESIKNFGEKIDLIISSPFERSKQTSQIVAEALGYSPEKIVYDDRICEWDISTEFEGKTRKEMRDYYDDAYVHTPEKKFSDGESFVDVAKRTGDFIYDTDSRYQDKNILIVSHSGASRGLFFASGGVMFDELVKRKEVTYMLDNAEIKSFAFTPMPHNKNYELDLHRPYIDDVPLICAHSTGSGQACGGNLVRIPEVLDCWFESGSMPFAQDHYPFENSDWQKNNFPAGFVAEYIGQVRTWFYYTHVVSAMLFNQAPFKNIVSTGTVRAEDGEKMSKSKHNYPDPWIFIDKYGVDALRIYLMSSTLMKGEDANFSEKAVQDIASKIIGRLFNVVAFYELYRDVSLEPSPYNLAPSQNVLDQWMMARFYQTLAEITKGMENYDMAEATRPIDALVDDLSTWYLRRSRERLKDGDKEAKMTLYFILKTLSQVLAPFAPFAAEDMWLKLKCESDTESVHLSAWPASGPMNDEVIKEMQEAREIVERVLFARQLKKINVRQALSELKLGKNYFLADKYLEIIKQETNIKNITESDNSNLDQLHWFDIRRFVDNPSEDMILNIHITKELKQEGNYREILRVIQDMRKKNNLNPFDKATVEIFSESEEGKNLLRQMMQIDFKKSMPFTKFDFKENNGDEVKIDDLVFKVKIEK